MCLLLSSCQGAASISCLGGLIRHRKPLGFISRAHHRVSAWLPHILFGNIKIFPSTTIHHPYTIGGGIQCFCYMRQKNQILFHTIQLARVGSVTYCLTRQHNQNSLRFFLQVESFLTKQHRSNIVWEWLSYWLGDSILGCLSSSLEDGKIQGCTLSHTTTCTISSNWITFHQ